MLLGLWHSYFTQDVAVEVPRRILGGSWVEHKPRNTFEDAEETKDDVLGIIAELRTLDVESVDAVAEPIIEAGNISDIFAPVANKFTRVKKPKALPPMPTSDIIGAIESGYESEYLLLLSY